MPLLPSIATEDKQKANNMQRSKLLTCVLCISTHATVAWTQASAVHPMCTWCLIRAEAKGKPNWCLQLRKCGLEVKHGFLFSSRITTGVPPNHCISSQRSWGPGSRRSFRERCLMSWSSSSLSNALHLCPWIIHSGGFKPDLPTDSVGHNSRCPHTCLLLILPESGPLFPRKENPGMKPDSAEEETCDLCQNLWKGLQAHVTLGCDLDLSLSWALFKKIFF